MVAEFTVKYFQNGKFSHMYFEIWDKLEEIYCPFCSNKGVWKNRSGDYYVGEEHICLKCEYSFYIPMGDNIKDEQKEQRLKYLNELETHNETMF